MEFFQLETTQIPPSPECVSIEDIAKTYRITDHIFYLKLKVTRKNTQNPWQLHNWRVMYHQNGDKSLPTLVPSLFFDGRKHLSTPWSQLEIILSPMSSGPQSEASWGALLSVSGVQKGKTLYINYWKALCKVCRAFAVEVASLASLGKNMAYTVVYMWIVNSSSIFCKCRAVSKPSRPRHTAFVLTTVRMS